MAVKQGCAPRLSGALLDVQAFMSAHTASFCPATLTALPLTSSAPKISAVPSLSCTSCTRGIGLSAAPCGCACMHACMHGRSRSAPAPEPHPRRCTQCAAPDSAGRGAVSGGARSSLFLLRPSHLGELEVLVNLLGPQFVVLGVHRALVIQRSHTVEKKGDLCLSPSTYIVLQELMSLMSEQASLTTGCCSMCERP